MVIILILFLKLIHKIIKWIAKVYIKHPNPIIRLIKKRIYQSKYPSITIITATTKNHFNSALAFISTVRNMTPHIKLVFYNLDTMYFPTSIYNYCKANGFTFKEFDYTKYPSWFQIESQLHQFNDRFYAGAYAWKSQIFYNELLESKSDFVVWCDAGNMIMHSLEKKIKQSAQDEPISFYDLIALGPVTSFTTGHTIGVYTHPDTIALLGGENYLDIEMKMGGFIVLNNKDPLAISLIKEWSHFCSLPEVVAPIGASFQNHRYDQAVFSILFYKYADQYGWTKHIGNIEKHITVQNDKKYEHIYGKSRFSKKNLDL
ncbi:MAG: DUF1647 domain-containing protein [Methylacidiphilales bacterium]|nr:DUF1647 domain-containing protein [Candidatus Methylacidiphilales bacterium]